MRGGSYPRITLPSQSFKTYGAVNPQSTHRRPATCYEVNCPDFVHGFKTVLPVGHDLLDVVRRSGRKYVETKIDGNLIEFVFEPGQNCFKHSQHTVAVDRPPLFVVREGDFRGNPRGTRPRLHKTADNWVEDFAEHQERIKKVVEG